MPRRGRGSNKAELTTTFTGENDDLISKANEAADVVERAMGRIDVTEAGGDLAEQLLKGVTAVGVGAFLRDGLLDGLDLGPVRSKLQGQLDLTSEEAGRVGALGADLFREAWGESAEETTQAIGRVASQLVDLESVSDEQLTSLTEKALAVAETWDLDFNEVIRATSQALDNELAPTADAALDLVARSLVNTQDRSDDLLDTINEYAPQFAAIGLDGEEAFGILNRGIELGVFNTDKLADAIKEFRVRAVEDNEAVADALAMVGLDAGLVGDAIAAGGDTAREAFQTVVEAIQSVDSPLEQQRIATELFGTAFEDLGPKALEALNPATSALEEVDGAAGKLADTLTENAATSIDEFQRKLGAVNDEMTEAWAPALQAGAEIGSDFLDLVLELPDPLQAVAGGLTAVGGIAVPTISAIGDLSIGVGGLSKLMATLKERAGESGGLSGVLSTALNPAVLLTAAGVTGLTVALDSWISGKREAEQRVVDFVTALELDTEALGRNSDALGENTQAAIDKKITDAELFDDLVQLDDAIGQQGRSYELLTAAIRGDADALRELNRDLEAAGELSSGYAEKTNELVRFVNSERDAFAEAEQRIADETAAKAANIEVSAGGAVAAGKVADAFDKQREAIDHAGQVTITQIETVEDYIAALDRLALATLESFDTELAYQNQVARTASEIAELGEALGDANSSTEEQAQALRDAQSAALRQAASAVAAAEAQAELEGRTLTANDKIGIQIQELGALALSLDPGSPLRAELGAYITQLSEIPTRVITDIGVSLDDTSVRTMLDTLEDLERRRNVPFFIPGVQSFATGGIVESNSDSFIARSGSPIRIFNEPLADGGESFIRLDGSDRSRRILAETADILGVPLGGGVAVGVGGGSQVVNQNTIVVRDANRVNSRRVGRRIHRELNSFNRSNGPLDFSTRRSRGGGG